MPRLSKPRCGPVGVGNMGKHSKNNNDRAFFSYHERKAASYGRLSSGLLGGHNTADGNHVSFGWGSESRTLDGDAMKEIDACSLSLQPCVEPVVTPSGILYDKQVVVEYILSRKKELERELRAWESQEAGQKAEAASVRGLARQRSQDESSQVLSQHEVYQLTTIHTSQSTIILVSFTPVLAANKS